MPYSSTFYFPLHKTPTDRWFYFKDLLLHRISVPCICILNLQSLYIQYVGISSSRNEEVQRWDGLLCHVQWKIGLMFQKLLEGTITQPEIQHTTHISRAARCPRKPPRIFRFSPCPHYPERFSRDDLNTV